MGPRNEDLDKHLINPTPPLVSTGWLAHQLVDPSVVVLDTRGRIPQPGTPPESMRSAFDDGHVPGARFVEWNHTFVDVDDSVPNQLAPPDTFQLAAQALGIDPNTHVVAYDDYHSIFAARLWWAFRAYGHDRVSVLDGGFATWQREARDVSRSESRVARAGTFVAQPRPELRWTLPQVARRDASVVLVDARSRARFAGDGTDPVGGHIPGAVNVPYEELVGDDGLLLPDTELRAAFARAGIDVENPPKQLVASCGSGISASVPLLALEYLRAGAGARGAVYDGSWAEWSRSGQPIERGA